jgi:hypothetical protein
VNSAEVPTESETAENDGVASGAPKGNWRFLALAGGARICRHWMTLAALRTWSARSASSPWRMIFKKKSLAAFQGSSSASRRQWRGCLFEEIQQGAAKGKAVSALCQMTGPHRAGFYRWRVPRQATPVEMEIRDQMQKIALESPSYGFCKYTVAPVARKP